MRKIMATKSSQVEYIVEQMQSAGVITYRKMFGEYGIYCNGKIVALVCDDQLFIKPTAAGKKYTGAINEAPPYPGAKPYLLIDENLDDSEWLGELVRITAQELPSQVKKKPRK
jgi:TfoX/Sxy family transcriptional regulator of competence genes